MDSKAFHRLNYYRRAYKLPQRIVEKLVKEERIDDLKTIGKFYQALESALKIDINIVEELMAEKILLEENLKSNI